MAVDGKINSTPAGEVTYTNTLTINGRAPSEAEILRYARSLDATGRFPEVTITSIHQVAGEEGSGGGTNVEGMEFILTLTTGEKS